MKKKHPKKTAQAEKPRQVHANASSFESCPRRPNKKKVNIFEEDEQILTILLDTLPKLRVTPYRIKELIGEEQTKHSY